MDKSDPRWKGPTIRDIAKLAGVGSASVDRVLNNRPGVKAVTRNRVMAALEKLTAEQNAPGVRQIALFCISGPAFNDQMRQAMQIANGSVPGVALTGHFFTTDAMEPTAFAAALEQAGQTASGVIVVAHEHPAINGALRKLGTAGRPTVCLTTDLPSSRRDVYVGNDQYAAGSVAAQLIGQILPRVAANILLVMSIPFRCQQDREMGFRRVLRQDFQHLTLHERVISNDDPDSTRDLLLRYLQSTTPPAAIYNVGGANRGVGAALKLSGLADKTIFIGHELTPYSRALLEEGTMDYVISHDFTAELITAAKAVDDRLRGIDSRPQISPILIHTRFNCAL